ncbi:hypothetical protein C2S53_006267 [Perilla frutescens var. hirtella]|uniref:Protein kinase domain-containing protein n=1 Tax=Perilla frutescens var. hirtella TaxID=608512 RepID=A0AAD4IUN3_PERFH|nr:hypothetical protein C2S53_006267 [Perilla frutescens var. hirtella]
MMDGKPRRRDVLSETTCFLLLLLLVFLNLTVSFGDESDAQLLLKFKASLKNTAALANWDTSTPPCSGWKGVVCDGGLVWGLQLEDMGLKGVIDIETLAKLPDLRSVSFMNNEFEGPLPNFARIGALKTIFVSNNKFSGEIPRNAFDGMLSLKKLHLANNKFSGHIPATLASEPKLMELTLQDNEFEGEIPNFKQQGLKTFNASNNRLSGKIPETLSHLGASSFSGNKELCGAPLQLCPSNEEESSRQLPVTTIIVVAVLVGAALIALVAVCIFFICRKKRSQQAEAGGTDAAAAATSSTADLNKMERGAGAAAEGGKTGGVRLTFLKEGVEKFDMQELLRSSAEVLGSSVFGSTYKTGLNGKEMVVKRFKHMNKVSKQEFNEHMRRLGRMSHQNVQPLVAFYYKKDEKLIVAEFAQNISLAARLHGNQTRDHRSLDWTTRLKIVKGVGKGLLYLHNELPSLTPAHGHLKASNVLLDASFKPLLTDYGLIPIVNQEQAEGNLTAYKSPEFKNGGKLTKKTDVWSFGMLMLEILTRKPSSLEQEGEVVDLEAIRDGGAAVFDKEMAGTNHSQGEMMELLNIALSCCHVDAEARPDMKEVVDKVEEIKEKDFDDDFYSSYASESDIRLSRGLSEDFKSINI